MHTMSHRVIVVGGGFGGLMAVRGLRRAPVEVVLIDRENFHLFQPLVYQVATGGLTTAEVATPLRRILRRQRNVRVMLGEVSGVDLDRREVTVDRLPNGQSGAALAYDTLIVAGGSHYSYFGHDEWREDAPELKSLAGALDIRERILAAFEAAEVEPDPSSAGAGSPSWSSAPGQPVSRWRDRSASWPTTSCAATSARPIPPPRGCSWWKRPTGCSQPSRNRSRRAPPTPSSASA